MKNPILMVSAMGNEIYLGTLKKNAKYPVMNESRILFTDQVIRAMIQHMQGSKKGMCYETDSGKLIWQPKKEESDPLPANKED